MRNKKIYYGKAVYDSKEINAYVIDKPSNLYSTMLIFPKLQNMNKVGGNALTVNKILKSLGF